MEKDKKLGIIEDMQAVAARMKQDDIDENPESEYELFECDCCAQVKPLAGSVGYRSNIRLCNDCVLIAETGFALGKFNDIDDLIKATEDTRLEQMCEFVKQNEIEHNN
jgi:hypothetical protein